MMGARWDSSLSWRVLGKTAQEREFLCVRGRREWMEICPWMGDEPAETLWVRVTEQTSMSDFVMGIKGL